MIFQYKGRLYPEYLKEGNGCQYVAPIALKFCKGIGLDIGCGKWPLEGAIGMELNEGADGMNLPNSKYDFIFSSHAIEHFANPIAALEHWKTRLKVAGVLFLYIPSPDQIYWLPQHCRKHLHSWAPQAMAQILTDLGFVNVIHSERDLAWGYSVVGWNA